ncbi:hypothetical protein NMG60_11022714 [Bertholletia excelsa]
MEVLNPTIPSRPHLFSRASLFSRTYSFAVRRRKNPYNFKVPNSRRFLYPLFSTRLPLSGAGKFRVSAHFGRHTNRQNSLRKKLTEEQQVRHNPVHDFDIRERHYLNLENDGEGKSGLNSNHGVNEDSDDSSNIKEAKTKPLGESVLWNKLESWIDQYKNDSEFWGIGFGPIFTVFQDSEGNIERIIVNEEEILRRSGIEPGKDKKSQLEDLTEVNMKMSHAKFLVREIERGNYVFPKNSSVAKFVVSGQKNGFANVIRSLSVQPRLPLKLPRVGIVVLCGLTVLWTMKTMFFGGKTKGEYTRLEKEMMRRKIKARKEKEKLLKGSTEIIQVPVEPQVVPIERPRLDKEELMNSIVKAKASISGIGLQDSSSSQATKSDKFESKIEEIRAMARRAREIERGDSSPSNKAEGDDSTVNELSTQEEVPKEQRGVVGLPDDISIELSGQMKGLNGALVPMSFTDLINYDNGVQEEALVKNGDMETSSTSRSKEVSIDDESSTQGEINGEAGANVTGMNGVSQSSGTLESNPSKLNKSFKARPRVICSVKEAKEFLAQRHVKQEPNQKIQDGTLPEGDAISSFESENKSDDGARQRLGKGKEVSDCDPAILNTTLDFTPVINSYTDSILKIKESFPTEDAEGHAVNGRQIPRALNNVANINTEEVPSVLASAREGEMNDDISQKLDEDDDNGDDDDDDKAFQGTLLGGPSGSASSANSRENSNSDIIDIDHEDVKKRYQVDDLQKPPPYLGLESNSQGTESIQSTNKEKWMERNFHELEPVLKKIGSGFRDNYAVAREKVKHELDINSNMIQPQSNKDDNELDWMKDEKLREIVFHVRENELAGHDPFYQMDEKDKLMFFKGLEREVVKENEKLQDLHDWLHSNIENLDYGTDGISLYDPPEKIIPRWKSPPVDKIPEFLNNPVKQGKTFSSKSLMKSDIQKSKESLPKENILSTSAVNDQNTKTPNRASKSPRTVIESSDGSVRAGKKSGKEYWQHTKKWSQGFLESYNAESDPEIKAVMRDMGKDLDRWITEKEIQEAADLMDKLPEKGRQFIEKKLNKVKREMELFGPQAVTSKYREYAEEKEEDYLWWLDLPFVLCIELYTYENGQQRIGLYSLEMAADLELDPKPYHVIAFEDPSDCKNLCYIIQSHMEMLGNGNAFVVARPPKDAFREAKANGFSVTVIRKGELKLNVDQTLEEVEEQITEIGSKIYHDKIMREHSVDISAIMKGVFGASRPFKRRRSRRRLKKPKK